MRSHSLLSSLALACALAGGVAHAQTPAAPTPTTPPEGIRPPAPEPAPLPKFSAAPPPPAIAPPAPLMAPAPAPETPRRRPPAKNYCADPANQKLTICKQQAKGG